MVLLPFIIRFNPIKKSNTICPISMRFLPHLQDTGGFFVAVFQRNLQYTFPKAQERKDEEEKPKESETEGEKTSNEQQDKDNNKAAKGPRYTNTCPFFIPPADKVQAVWPSIKCVFTIHF